MYDDSESIRIIQENKDQHAIKDALDSLISRHSGIYFDMSKKFLPQKADWTMDVEEAKDELPTFFWECAKEYDASKGCKFSTRLGERARFKFLNSRKMYKDKKRVAEPVTNVPPDDKFWEQFEYEDESRKEVSNKSIEMAFDKIKELGDELITKIFTERYLNGQGNKLMSWWDVADKVGRSHENCRQIHDAALKLISEKFLRENS
jgi:hypothetical protein